jgi:hypothetical protein
MTKTRTRRFLKLTIGAELRHQLVTSVKVRRGPSNDNVDFAPVMRKTHYSGKRKRHTAKKQLTVNENGLIMQRTNLTKGRMYDYEILRAIRRSFQKESDHRPDFGLLRPATTSAVAHTGGPRLGLKRLRCARFVGSRFASAIWENTNRGARRGRRKAPPVNYHVIFIYH